MTITRRAIIRGALASGAALSCASARAQSTYPDRPVKMIVPFPPGGFYDTIGRPLADRLKSHLGTIVVENMGGAGSARGASLAARADPDGYTLFLGGNASHVIIPIASRRPVYNPMTDFDPVALIGVVGLAIVVNPGQPMRTLGELVTFAKDNPGKLSFGSAGTGSMTHLTGEMLKLRATVPGIVHVPYTGAGPVMNDLIGGHIPLGVVTLSSQVLDLHASGKIRIIAVTTPKRLSVAPNVQTATEAVPGLVSLNFAGVFVPKGTPPAIITQVSAAVGKSIADPELLKLYEAGGVEVRRDNDPAVLREFLRNEHATWRPVIEASGFAIN